LNKTLATIRIETDKQMVKKFIEDNHYSHKIPQAIKYRFGLYYENALKGMAIFSVPANMYSITSIFYDEPQQIGIELSRFFTYNNTPDNFESYCLSQCFKYLRNNSNYDVIVSYADPNFNHVGYLYQALNGLYLGVTNPETRYILNGQLLTRRSLGRKKGDTERENADRILFQGAKKIKMQGKHKYLFFICNKKRKYELLNNLKDNIHIIKEYPKLNNDKNKQII
jgi:hypothetical protein